MKTNWLILSLAFITLLSWQKAYSQEDYSGLSPKEHIIANLLFVDKSAEKTKVAAKILFSHANPSTLILDIASIRLVQLNEGNIDTASWLIKAIGESKRKRYEAFLTNLKNRRKNEKIRRYLNKAIKDIKSSPGETYFNIGEYDSNILEKNIAKSNSKEIFTLDYVDIIDNGDSINTIYKQLGRPSSVSIFNDSKMLNTGYLVRGTYKKIHIQNFKIYYKGSGYITFKNAKGQFVAGRTIHEYLDNEQDTQDSETTSPEELTADFYGNLYNNLIPADPEKSHSIAKTLSSQRRYKEEYFDISVEKIWLEKNTTDPFMTDAISHLIRYIGNGKNPRYVAFVKKMVKETKNKKFRKHAKKALRSLPKNIDNIEQYIPPETR